MSSNEVSFVRIDLNAISISGDTLHFDTVNGPQNLRCEDVEVMCGILNHLADQFVPIIDDEGRQINPYYGDGSLGLDRPGKAFYVEKREGVSLPGGPQFRDLRVLPSALTRDRRSR